MPVGQGPHQHGSWSHSSRARGGRAGPEQGSQPRDGWAGTCGWAEAGLGCQPMAGGQGQEWGGGRLRSTCHLAQARPRVRAAASKQVLSEGPHLSQQLARSSASWLSSCTGLDPNAGQAPTSGWVKGDLHAGRLWNVMLLSLGLLVLWS